MTAQAVEAHGTLTVADIARFQYFHMLRRLWPVLPLLGLIALLNILFFATGNTSAGQTILPFSILFLLWMAIPFFSARRLGAARPYILE